MGIQTIVIGTEKKKKKTRERERRREGGGFGKEEKMGSV